MMQYEEILGIVTRKQRTVQNGDALFSLGFSESCRTGFYRILLRFADLPQPLS